jgi:F-box and WD-40 domain protein CDC4
MPAPQGSQTLDPKLYPLASTPTPPSIKDIRFSIGGKSIIFNEPEDTLGALDEVTINSL